MTFTRQDFQEIEALAGVAGERRYFLDCPLRAITWRGQQIGVSGPAPGAPYAVMVLEKLIALGAQTIIALGWCGSLRSEALIGDLILPEAAYSEEGTSGHYPGAAKISRPEAGLCQALRRSLNEAGCGFHAGTVWTTDAIYRETRRKVAAYGALGMWAVEMEMSALFNVARYRGVALAGLLLVSDELFTLTWRHGLRDEGFHAARRQTLRLVLDVLSSQQP
ncbi:MAG: nucleoside phosphorylase [Desulfobacca sp.]|uniref:nucleoside phosphorylase n=1 Tax=Desulfobacca sp. TaxID=2067990 RepID=UPI004049B52A